MAYSTVFSPDVATYSFAFSVTQWYRFSGLLNEQNHGRVCFVLFVCLFFLFQAFMFESSLSMAITKWGNDTCQKVDHDYYKAWQPLRKHFNPDWKPVRNNHDSWAHKVCNLEPRRGEEMNYKCVLQCIANLYCAVSMTRWSTAKVVNEELK